MSESVWFEQVDTSLINLIQSVIHIDGVPVKVVVRKPDDDFYDEDYPVVSIYNLSDKFSRVRYDPEPVIISRDIEHNRIYMERSALPYDLLYQIDFWSVLQSDMNSMTKQWKAFADFWFNLSVQDESGNPRSCFVLSRNDFNKSDLLQNGRRLFHSFGTYKVSVEIDENVVEDVPMVTHDINTLTDPDYRGAK